MAGQYIISFTDPAKGTFTINELETEGPGSFNSIPIVSADSGLSVFTVGGDFTPRFVPDFDFNVINSVVAPPTNNSYSYTVNGVIVGLNGTWTIAGNHAAEFAAADTFDIVGNTGTNYPIAFVVNGLHGTFTIAGNLTTTFTPGVAFTVQGSTANDDNYAVQSSTFSAGNTIITVTGIIPSVIADGQINIGGNGIYTVLSATNNGGNTDIVVNETIPIGATGDGSLVLDYEVVSSVFQGTDLISAISAPLKKFILNGADYTTIFTPGRIFKIINSNTPSTNNGYWLTTSSAFIAGNTEITVQSGAVPTGIRDGNTIDGSGSAATPIQAANSTLATFTVGNDQTSYFTPGFNFSVSGTPSNNGAYVVLSSSYNVIANQTTIIVTTAVPANQLAIGTITFALVTGSIATNLTAIVVSPNVPVTSTVPDGNITYTLPGHTSLTLPGRGSINYGQTILENLVHMLENWSYPIPPLAPTNGQLWYDNVLSTMRVWDSPSSSWLQVGTVASSIRLNAILPALATNIINNGDFEQEWEWALDADPQFGMLFSESLPATGGAGNQSILAANVELGSSASPFTVTRGGFGGAGQFIFTAYPATPGNDGADLYLNGTQAETAVGVGGGVFIAAGNNAAAGSGSPGIATLGGGNTVGVSTVDAGYVSLVGGSVSGSGSGNGGSVFMNAGTGRGAQLNGGNVVARGGFGTANGVGGDIGLYASFSNNSEGGVVTIMGGLTKQTSGYSIQNSVAGANGTFTVVGDKTNKFYPGFVFTVSGSAGNDGTYTTLSSVWSGGPTGTTDITVASVPVSTPTGTIFGFTYGGIALVAGDTQLNHDGAPINILAGNATTGGGGGGRKGGSIHLKGGDSAGVTGASQGGDVKITAGQNAFNPDQGFFTIETGTPTTNRLTINGNGAWFLNGLAGNPGDVFTSNGNFVPPTWNPSTASTPLNNITAATGANTINNGDFDQVWNWSMTTNGTTAFTFGENIPSVGLGTTLVTIGTATGSTATPFSVTNQTQQIIATTAAGAVALTAQFGESVTINALNAPGAFGGSVQIFGGNAPAGGSVGIQAGSASNPAFGAGSSLLDGGTSPAGFGATVHSNGGSASGGGSLLMTGGNAAVASGLPGGAIIATAGVGDGVGSGGALFLEAGNGSATSGGGVASIQGGSGGSFGGLAAVIGGVATGTGATGGQASILGGAATDGNGGGVNIQANSGTGTDRNGGSTTILAGNATGTGAAGILSLTSGSAGTNGAGGQLNIFGGTGGTIAGGGGTINIQGGLATINSGGGVAITGGTGIPGGGVSITGGLTTNVGGSGGSVAMFGGTPTDGNGGSVSMAGSDGVGANRSGGIAGISAGAATGTGTPGYILQTTTAGYVVTEGGKFVSNGDAQSKEYQVRTLTTNAALTELFLDGTGGAIRMTLTTNSAWRFELHLVAYETVGANVGWTAAYEIKGAIKNVAGTTSIVGSVSSNVTADDSGGIWTVTVDADNGNSALRVQVTGQAATTIRWVAFIRTVEVSA